jgi:uncharacterized protein (DUF433 family)
MLREKHPARPGGRAEQREHSMVTKRRATPRGRITIDPEVLAGKPVVRGTRISVELVLQRLSQQLDVEELIAAFPRLTRRDIQACVEYAQWLVEGEADAKGRPPPDPATRRARHRWRGDSPRG